MLDVQYRLKQAGLRVTHSRMAVLKLLEQQGDDLTIKQIYQKLHVQHQQLSLATIYRVVSDLVDAGLIASYQFHCAEAKFNLPDQSKKQVLHIQCSALSSTQQAQFLQSLQAVFQQFQVDLMQLEIQESA
ncbi:Fur family transcriptional regulator [Acinetobacter guerrae]|uniref:Fur family transcriptional regulator n=1 Tax=Acinetobacter guerrae TaxID=1843371 RepID=UPI00125FBE83|nr:transcriptional repressor [Acinetobacter guerrae]